MRITSILPLLLLATSCHSNDPPHQASRASLIQVACSPVESFGAIADDGLDDRGPIQAALNSGCAKLGKGRYDIITPPLPRTYQILIMPQGSMLTGIGNMSQMVFSGDPANKDWRGIQLSGGTSITSVSLSIAELSTSTTEQTHVIRVDGPATGIKIEDVSIDHPVVQGTKRGDCLQFVGYDPTPTSPDKRIIDVSVSHVDFLHCARSGIAVHSGLHSFRFTDNRFLGTSDQDIDFEGSGDITDGDIGDNDFITPQYYESGIAVSIMLSDRIRFHHNLLDGRGLDLYGCNGCEIDHNHIVQSVPFNGAVVTLRKTSHTVSFHDEDWERQAGANAGAVLAIAQKIGAPDDITVADSKIVQGSPFTAITSWGIVGLTLRGNRIEVPQTNQGLIGVLVNGSAGELAIKTDDLHILGNEFIGPFKWLAWVSGSYAGVGSIEFSRNSSVSSIGSMFCDNVSAQGGIAGPIRFINNSIPATSPACQTLLKTVE